MNTFNAINKSATNLGKFSYKILNNSDALVFNKTKIFRGTKYDLHNGFIHLSKDLVQCKGVLYKFFPSQSIVIYKLNNDKLINLQENIKKNGESYLKYEGQLTEDHIIDSKSIHHDCNDIMTYWHEINNLENLFGNSNIFVKEYAIKY